MNCARSLLLAPAMISQSRHGGRGGQARRTVITWLLLLQCFFLSSVVLLSIVLPAAEADRDDVLFCGACIALVEELNWLTGITNPKLRIQVGSFHLDAKGNSGAKSIPLATSETHLTEIYETVCRYMHYYAKATAPNGHTNYILTQSRDGNKISTKGTEISDEVRRELRFACDWVLEEYDDWMVPYYKEKDEKIAKKLCVEHSGLCKEHNVSDHLWAYASAVMEGQRERWASDSTDEDSLDEAVDDDDDDDDYDDEEEVFADDDDDDEPANVIRAEL